MVRVVESPEGPLGRRDRLAARRAAVGYTQETLAERLGISTSTAARWEQGLSSPRPGQRPKLAGLLGVTLDGLDHLLAPLTVIGSSPAEAMGRLFFGDTSVTIAIPLRQVAERPLPVISSEDVLAGRRLDQLLSGLGLDVGELRIPPHGIWEPPPGDVVAICGPKSSPIIARALAADPYVAFEPDDVDRWVIQGRGSSGARFVSPIDSPTAERWSDVAYIGRVAIKDRLVLVVAGIHALGSVGAVDYLIHNFMNLYREVGTQRFSMVVRSVHDGEAVIMSELLCLPRIHT